MKKTLLITMIFLGIVGVSNAQGYSTAIGARFGSPLSASFKKFINDSDRAIELNAGYRNFDFWNWYNVSGALQIHKDINDVEGLMWYYGGGASVYFWSFNNDFFGDRSVSTSFGVQGYIGLDYKFANAPVSVTLDWVPTLFIRGLDSGFGAGYGALAVRYTIGQ